MNTRLMVGNLSLETTADELQSLFGYLGKILSIEIATPPDTKRSQGFAFVEVDIANSLESVVSKVGITELDGRVLQVKAVERSATVPRPPSR